MDASKQLNKYPQTAADLEAAGVEIEVPDANQLQLDLDNTESIVAFVDGVALLQEHLPGFVHHLKIRRSQTAGHYHVVITLDQAVTAMTQVALQAGLGSDRRRELANYVRISQGVPNPILLAPKGYKKC